MGYSGNEEGGEKIFENPAAGASPDAIKVVVLITDGDPSDSDKDHIIKRYDDKTIIRFVIGRIMGEKIKTRLRFFGQAIDGDTDLGEDRLPDIVTGAQGTAVVLRSRLVFNVSARLSFEPQEISTEKIDCLASTDETTNG
ncbi:hypothetical protein L3Q82_005224 [Scortum barcoo]|uniref:Uncharacterized protein n=1 Tax=Scortum barcoo TaxID=214431 RepID=A0ACB8VAI8_9TELE|nr:hypothetical protein L3Q82_005224 [Scortum barcoo]